MISDSIAYCYKYLYINILIIYVSCLVVRFKIKLLSVRQRFNFVRDTGSTLKNE